MTSTDRDQADREGLTEALARAVCDRGLTVAAAESLTSGQVATALGAGPDASTWFRGGVVAYAPEVKAKVLDVPPGPVVTRECPLAMACGVAGLLDADLAVAVTGVGGPGESEGHPAGTVWFGLVGPDGDHAERRRFDGDPPAVLEATTRHALHLLTEAARGS